MMPSSKTYKKNELYFVPLGGSEQFGVNLNVYISDGDFLAVDCGIGFADERFPGIDLLLPNPVFLEKNKKKLKGLIITHAHEDHIGAVAYLWHRLECPIYASEFTAIVLKSKMEELGGTKPLIKIIEPLQKVQIGSFEVQFVPVSHSVPDTQALMIRTNQGNIFHSADWNLDPQPIIGKKTDKTFLKNLGNDEILAYVGDSTNAQVEGVSGSETEVAKGLSEEFKKCKGRIAITIFASNIGRIKSIAKAAKETGRDVGIVGRSLHKMVSAAQKCGYLKDIKTFISEDDIETLADHTSVMIVTGSQGEYRSALAKIARGDHRTIALRQNDTVIFSSRAIPGNEKNINTVKNNLSAAGIRVITPADTTNTIHVSGHPCRDEIRKMLEWLHPRIVIPVHGERIQLDAHAALARTCGVENTIVPTNGALIKLSPGPAKIIDHVETGILAVDQDRVIPSDHQSITARRKLQYTGAVHVSVVLDSKFRILGTIKLDIIGISDGNSELQLIEDIEEEVKEIISEIAEGPDLNESAIAEELRICLRRFIYNILGTKPKTTVHVTKLNI